MSPTSPTVRALPTVDISDEQTPQLMVPSWPRPVGGIVRIAILAVLLQDARLVGAAQAEQRRACEVRQVDREG